MTGIYLLALGGLLAWAIWLTWNAHRLIRQAEGLYEDSLAAWEEASAFLRALHEEDR